LEREYHNIHTALVWGVADGKNAESVLRLVSLVPDFWYARKEFTSVQNGIRKLLENPELVVPARVRGFALISFGSMSAFFPAGFPEAHESFERALKIFRELNDKRGIACALYTIGFIKAEMFDLEGSRRYLEESLACLRALDDRYGVAVVLHDVGHVMSWQGEPGLGRALIEEGRAALKEFGVLGWAARATLFLGHIARREGDYERARSLYLEAGTLSDDDKHLLPLRSFMGALVIGFLAAAEKQYERAVRLFGAAERLASDLGTSITPMDRVEYDEYVAQARRALGDAGFKEAFESGRKLTMEQAILLTLTVVQTPSPVAELTLSAQH
jgi:non-specific serine/threonine protein kinase